MIFYFDAYCLNLYNHDRIEFQVLFSMHGAQTPYRNWNLDRRKMLLGFPVDGYYDGVSIEVLWGDMGQTVNQINLFMEMNAPTDPHLHQ